MLAGSRRYLYNATLIPTRYAAAQAPSAAYVRCTELYALDTVNIRSCGFRENLISRVSVSERVAANASILPHVSDNNTGIDR